MIDRFKTRRWARVLAFVGVLPALSFGASWNDLPGMTSDPLLVLIATGKEPPESLPFLEDRKKEAGVWAAFADPAVVKKIGSTLNLENTSEWKETAFRMYLLSRSEGWKAFPLVERSGAGGIRAKGKVYALHQVFWSNLQGSRLQIEEVSPDKSGKIRKGAFRATMSERSGPVMSKNDEEANPLIGFDGDPSKELAEVVVPESYDGFKPFGLFVCISPRHNGGGSLFKQYGKELAERNYIWISPLKAGNNQPGDRRVWMAQLCRAWALHHYRIDPQRMVISGTSNGGDSAAATLVRTPMGFSSTLLIAPPMEPPVGPVTVPRESDHTRMVIQPLSKKGIAHIRKHVRAVYYCGTEDRFLKYCQESVRILEKELKQGCKFILVDGLGHKSPDSIAEGLDYLDEPRRDDTKNSKSSVTFSTESLLRPIQSAMKSDLARARKLFAKFWDRNPELRNDPEVLQVLEALEAIPKS